MDKNLINILLIIIDYLQSHEEVKFNNLSDVLNLSDWQKGYGWLSEHHSYNNIRMVVTGSNQITRCNNTALLSLKRDLENDLNLLEKQEEEHKLEIELKKDTLRNNKITRNISYISILISAGAFILSLCKSCS